MGLLSKKDRQLITDPLSDNNPITVQVLSICSALAITAVSYTHLTLPTIYSV